MSMAIGIGAKLGCMNPFPTMAIGTTPTGALPAFMLTSAPASSGGCDIIPGIPPRPGGAPPGGGAAPGPGPAAGVTTTEPGGPGLPAPRLPKLCTDKSGFILSRDKCGILPELEPGGGGGPPTPIGLPPRYDPPLPPPPDNHRLLDGPLRIGRAIPK